MKITIDNRPGRNRCRYCKERSRWDVMRHKSSWNVEHNSVCDKHFGTAMRNIGLVNLGIEQNATCTAEIRP